MPAPQASMMQQLARAKFMSNALKVPKDWSQPSGDNGHYNKAFQPSEMAAAPGAPPLFIPASVNKYHVDTQKMLNEKVGNFIDGICSAICSAWSQWQSAASMAGIVVNSVTATGGQVIGPPLMPLIMASAPKESPQLLLYSTAVANVMNTTWLSFTSMIKIPGLPLFPMFAAFPSPVAPPTPSPVPAPLAALAPAASSLFVANSLGSQMLGMFGNPTANYAREIFDAVATGIQACFTTWYASTMFTKIMGTGPVPSFAPPYVPVGPVVGGTGMMTPGSIV